MFKKFKVALKSISDERGKLIVLDRYENLTFDLKRAYYIYGTEKNTTRGFHAHRKLTQLAICLNGSVKLMLDDGAHKENFLLTQKDEALIIAPLIWHEMCDFSKDCILLVLANDYYKESDYIRDYNEFLSLANSQN